MIRILSAIVLVAILLSVVWFLPPSAFYALMTIACTLSLLELTHLFFEDFVEKIATLLTTLFIFLLMLFARDLVLSLLPLILFFLALVFMWRAKDLHGVANRLGIACLSLLGLGISFASWGDLRQAGPEWVLFILAPACLTDTMGLVVGKAIGSRKFAPLVSPQKTWEGFFGALVGSLLGTFSVWFFFLQTSLSFEVTMVVAIIIWIVSPLGDLIESMLKRSIGVKDSGHLIPGHGGMLDRVDALLFAAPISYLYLSRVVGVLP